MEAIDKLFNTKRNTKKGGEPSKNRGGGFDNHEDFADLVKKPKVGGGEYEDFADLVKKPKVGGGLKNKGGLNIAPFISTLAILGTRLLNDKDFMKNANFKLLSSSKSKSTKSKSKSRSSSKMSKGGDGDTAAAGGEPVPRTIDYSKTELPKQSGMGEENFSESVGVMSDHQLNELKETINSQATMQGGKKRSSKKPSKKSSKKPSKKPSKKCPK